MAKPNGKTAQYKPNSKPLSILNKMIKFTYNNAKNANIGHEPFELNCGYHFHVLYKKDFNLCSKLKSADKLLANLKELMIVCWENLYHAQKLQKQAHNQNVQS